MKDLEGLDKVIEYTLKTDSTVLDDETASLDLLKPQTKQL